MPPVTDPTKRVTDPVALAHLQRQGRVAANWEFWHDYGSHHDAQGNKRKEFNPFAKFYINTDNPAERMMVVSGLPMVDTDGVKCDPRWFNVAGPVYQIRNNVFAALYNDQLGTMTLTCRNDQPDLIKKKNWKVNFSPQLFVSGIEIPKPAISLLPVDPMNSNYLENVLQWDYGDVKRWVRTVEGRYHGYWLRPVSFNQPIRVVYNQTGEYKLKLSPMWATSDDVEEVPAVINQPQLIPTIVYQGVTYYLISDSATYNPDASPETTSVDGYVQHFEAGGNTWANIRGGAGTTGADDNTFYVPGRIAANAADYNQIDRGIALFDTSGLPDSATISAATLSVYGRDKSNNTTWSTTFNVYSSAPASNTAIVAGDFDSLGTTAYSNTAITYASFSTAGYNDWAFNATGIAAISKTGVSKFGHREAAYDAANSAPGVGLNYNNYAYGYAAEQGAGFKPKLVVTYTVATTQGKSPFMAAKLMRAGVL